MVRKLISKWYGHFGDEAIFIRTPRNLLVIMFLHEPMTFRLSWELMAWFEVYDDVSVDTKIN